MCKSEGKRRKKIGEGKERKVVLREGKGRRGRHEARIVEQRHVHTEATLGHDNTVTCHHLGHIFV